MTSFVLKIIAIISMFIDHAFKILPVYTVLTDQFGASQQTAYFIIVFAEIAGRIAFPLFAFGVAEGCRYTHSPKRYVGRLLLFAAISEVPFQFAFFDGHFSLGTRNVFFTLALGAVACIGYTRFQEKWKDKSWAVRVIAPFLAPLFCAAISIPMQTDYDIWGVGFIFLAYLLPKKAALPVLGVWLTLLYLGFVAWNGTEFRLFVLPDTENPVSFLWNGYFLYWYGALVSLVLIGLYRGKRGPRLKWFFYLFYPVHLLLLYGIQIIWFPQAMS